MSTKVFIYGLKNPKTNLIFYIGQTIDIQTRLREHIYKSKLYLHKEGRYKIIRDLLEEGLSPTYDLIETCDETNWREREIYWINYYQELYGVENVSIGGEPSSFVKGTPAWNKGMTGIYADSSLELMRKKKIGIPLSNETKRKMSISRMGRITSQETRDKLAARATPVLQYDLEGNFIKEWISTKAASQELDVAIGEINLCCRGKIKSSFGFTWRRKLSDEIPQKIEINITQSSNKVVQMDMNSNIIKVWDNAKECASELGYYTVNLRNACKKEITYKGYLWKYIIVRGINKE